MTNESESLDITDIAPILGNLQLTILQQDKTIQKLRERVKEFESKTEMERLDGKKPELAR